MGDDQLALHGGPRTVANQRPYTVHRVRRGLQRSWDILGMLPYTARGITSINDGSGVVGRFQNAFARLTGSRHALAMNSGTGALHSAFFAVGVGPGDEVIVPAYTWHASATPVLQCGATPVFCEVDPATLTMDPDDMERRITERTRAICVVHTWGNPADMDPILAVAERHGLKVVEDASHGHGGRYKGRGIGSLGHVGCFSMQGSKTVEGGEAGVAVTDDPEIFDRMVLLGHNVMVKKGQVANTFPDYGDLSLGVKYRPHLAGMVLALAALKRLPKRNRQAARAWGWMRDELEGVRGIRPQADVAGAERGGYYAFVFEYTGEGRGGPGTEAFVEAVAAEGCPIDFDQFRGRLLHRLPIFDGTLDRSKLGGGAWDPTRPWAEQCAQPELPVSEALVDRLVKLPIWLFDAPEPFVRSCARAVRKVLEAVVPAESPASEEAPAERAAAESA